MNKLLHHAFESSCARLPGKTALVCGDDRPSYARLAQQVATLARLLRARGVAPGDRVVLYLDSSIEFAVGVHAVLAAGAVFVPVSPLTRADKLAYMLGDTQATALLTDHRLAATWRDALARAPSVATCVSTGCAQSDGIVLPWPAAENSLARAEGSLPTTASDTRSSS